MTPLRAAQGPEGSWKEAPGQHLARRGSAPGLPALFPSPPDPEVPVVPTCRLSRQDFRAKMLGTSGLHQARPRVDASPPPWVPWPPAGQVRLGEGGSEPGKT